MDCVRQRSHGDIMVHARWILSRWTHTDTRQTDFEVHAPAVLLLGQATDNELNVMLRRLDLEYPSVGVPSMRGMIGVTYTGESGPHTFWTGALQTQMSESTKSEIVPLNIVNLWSVRQQSFNTVNLLFKQFFLLARFPNVNNMFCIGVNFVIKNSEL